MNRKLLIIDTETGGLDPSKYSILSLGAVVWEDGELLGEFSVAIAEPEIITEPEAMAINKIDIVSHRETAVAPADAVKSLLTFLSSKFPNKHPNDRITLCGHNIIFDVSFMKRLFRMSGSSFEDYFSHRVVDTASIVRFLILAGLIPIDRAKSTLAFDFFGVTISPAERHTAIGDARATARLMSAMLAFVRRSPASR